MRMTVIVIDNTTGAWDSLVCRFGSEIKAKKYVQKYWGHYPLKIVEEKERTRIV